MRRLIVAVVLVLALSAAPATAASKIGFVNAEQVMAAVEEGQQEFAKLRAWQDPKQAELDRLRDRVLALREQMAKEQASGNATPEALQAIERNEIDALRAFEDARRDYERELEAKRNEFLEELAAKIGAVGSEYAKANGYDAVFLLTAQPMVYVSDAANLTDEIIDAYNERYPADGS